MSSTHFPDTSDIVASVVSPSRNYFAVLRETADVGSVGSKKRYVEVWSHDRVVASEEVTSTHGSFYTDGALLQDQYHTLV